MRFSPLVRPRSTAVRSCVDSVRLGCGSTRLVGEQPPPTLLGVRAHPPEIIGNDQPVDEIEIGVGQDRIDLFPALEITGIGWGAWAHRDGDHTTAASAPYRRRCRCGHVDDVVGVIGTVDHDHAEADTVLIDDDEHTLIAQGGVQSQCSRRKGTASIGDRVDTCKGDVIGCVDDVVDASRVDRADHGWNVLTGAMRATAGTCGLR